MYINQIISIICNVYVSHSAYSHSSEGSLPDPSTSSDGVEEEVGGCMPPHYHITIRCTREIAGFNGLTEAVKRLDFRRSVRDRKRFHYICAFLLLVSNKGIASLPGSAQRQLLQMVEEVASHGEFLRECRKRDLD